MKPLTYHLAIIDRLIRNKPEATIKDYLKIVEPLKKQGGKHTVTRPGYFEHEKTITT